MSSSQLICLNPHKKETASLVKPRGLLSVQTPQHWREARSEKAKKQNKPFVGNCKSRVRIKTYLLLRTYVDPHGTQEEEVRLQGSAWLVWFLPLWSERRLSPRKWIREQGNQEKEVLLWRIVDYLRSLHEEGWGSAWRLSSLDSRVAGAQWSLRDLFQMDVCTHICVVRDVCMCTIRKGYVVGFPQMGTSGPRAVTSAWIRCLSTGYHHKGLHFELCVEDAGWGLEDWVHSGFEGGKEVFGEEKSGLKCIEAVNQIFPMLAYVCQPHWYQMGDVVSDWVWSTPIAAILFPIKDSYVL